MSIRFAPINKNHAIEQVVFVVLVPAPFEEKTFGEIRYENLFKERYPFPVDHLGVMTGIGSDPPHFGPLPLAPSPHRVGLQFCDRFPDYTKTLFIHEKQISATEKRYDKWETTSPNICEELGKVLAISGQHAEGISLAYYDTFISLPQPETADGKKTSVSWEQGELFTPGCPYLPTVLFGQEEPWHSHNGFFQTTDDGRNMLVNVNFHRQRRPDNREEVSMTTSCAMAGQQIGASDLESVFNDLHTCLKAAARRALSDAVGLAIGLSTTEETSWNM